MTTLLVLAGLLDLAVLGAIVRRALGSPHRGMSLRLRLFFALTVAALTGALMTGLYAVALDAETLGFAGRFARVLPKGFLVASAIVPLLAAVAYTAGARLARPVEELSEEAARIAEGGARATQVRSGGGAEAQKLARALSSMRREREGRPYAAAYLRDAWHDLKTPVAAIAATLEVLEDGALDDPVAARRFLENLRRSTVQLDRRLRDLVTLARFETAALREPVPTDVVALATSALEMFRPLAEASAVRLVPPASRAVTAPLDDAAFSRALGNLIHNAVRASPRGTVTVAVQSPAGDVVVVDVSNEPAEIPPEIRGRLFERAALASRAGPGDGPSERDEGSGLGLAIARAAVEAHGGTIRFVELGPPRVVVRIELPR